jgi:hypothetical protein
MKKQQKKSGKPTTTEKIVLATVLIKLIHEIFDFIKCLVE